MSTTSDYAAIPVEDSLEALLGDQSAQASGLYLASLLVLIGVLFAVGMIPVEVDVRAPAIIRPANERQTLRVMTDGTVDQMRGTRGAFVSKGDTIVLLRSIESSEALRVARGTQREQQALARDLRAMLALSFDDRRSDLSTEPVTLELARSRVALAEADAERRQLSVELRHAQQALERQRQLVRRGFAATTELEAAEHEVARAQGSRVVALERRRAMWSTELADSEQRLRELERVIAVTLVERDTRAIVAPTSGTIEELASVTAGSSVRAGDPVATISPDATLVAEASLAPRHAGWVRPSMAVHLLVEGYDVLQWGFAKGVVASVGNDFAMVGDQPVFQVRIRLCQAELHGSSGRVAPLRKGLKAQARFIVDHRTIGQILLRRGREWIDGSSPEPVGAQ